MAQELVIYRKCHQCNGTGIHQSSHGLGGSPITCNWPGCNGTGYIATEKITYDPGHDDIMDKCNDILDKCNNILDKCNDILEQLNPA